jgi:hypothetical protein
MRTFILTHQQFEGDIEFGFDDRGFISSMHIRAELIEKTLYWITTHYPLTTADLIAYEAKMFAIQEIPVDLSFDAFWKVWPEVKGNRARAEKVWGRMTESDRALALRVMPAYMRYIAKNTFKNPKWPDRWLSEQCYKNDYNKL